MFITIPSVSWADSCPSVCQCSAVGKHCWGWLAHTSGCREPEESWPLPWVMRNQWLRAGGRGLFWTPSPSRRAELWQSGLGWKREGRENPSVSGYGCVPQAGSNGHGPVKKVPSDFVTGRKLPSGNPWAHMGRASGLHSTPTDLLGWTEKSGCFLVL